MKIRPTVWGFRVASMTLGFVVGCSDAGNVDGDQISSDSLTGATPRQNADAAAPPQNTDAAGNPAAPAPTSQCTIGNFNPLPGYNAALWVDKGFFPSGSTACVTFYSETNHAVVWNGTYNGYDVLGGAGLPDINKTVDSINTNASGWHHHKFASTNTGRGIYTLYGRGKSSGLEWYIVDDWFGPKPNGRGAQYLKGSIDVDGDTYDIFEFIGTLSGSTAPFHQWWSIRRTARTSGVVSYAKHYQKWRSLGMPDELMREVRFIVEANGPVGRGKLDVYSLDFLSQKP